MRIAAAHSVARAFQQGASMLVLQGVRARGRVHGLFFELDVEQRYRNPRDHNVEVVYTFALPHGAVLLDIEVELAGRRLVCAVAPKAAAQAQYEQAIDAGDTPIMLEHAADGLCTLNLGNLMSGEAATIRYRYAQTLRATGGSVRLAVPTTVAPRYGDPTAAGLQPHQPPEASLHADYPFSIAIDLAGDLAGCRVSSPSHPISTARTGEGLSVTLAAPALLDRDFVLRIEDLPARPLVTLARDGMAWVAMASLLPADGHVASGPVALKILVDCSGSMQGDSIRLAREAVMAVLGRLETGDTFAVTRFGTRTEHLCASMIGAGSVPAGRVGEEVAALAANLGGTEMAAALDQVYAIKARRGADVLLVTDGEIWNVEPLIAAARASGHRVFAIGVGAAPAGSLLQRLAEETGGACELLATGDPIAATALRMLGRARTARCEEVALEWPAAPDWTCGLPRNVYPGDTVHVYAGFRTPPVGEVALRYRIAGATVVRRATTTLSAAPGPGEDSLARLAADRRLRDIADAEVARDLAVRYRLLTPHTNLLVVLHRAGHEKALDLPALARVPHMTAAGWGGIGVAGSPVDYCDMFHDAGHLSFASREVHPGVEMQFDGRMRALKEAVAGTPADLMQILAARSVGSGPLPSRVVQSPRTPAEVLQALAEGIVAGRPLPTRIVELAILGVPSHFLAALLRLQGTLDIADPLHVAGSERIIVAALLLTLLASPLGPTIPRHAARAIRALPDPFVGRPALAQAFTGIAPRILPVAWPSV